MSFKRVQWVMFCVQLRPNQDQKHLMTSIMSDSEFDIIRADNTNHEAKIEYSRIAERARKWFKLVLEKVKKTYHTLYSMLTCREYSMSFERVRWLMFCVQMRPNKDQKRPMTSIMSDSESDIIRADRTNREAKIEYTRTAARERRWFKLVLTKVKKDRSYFIFNAYL